ncbi:MAG: ATP phosphoribosyltransferase [Spirochaetota bacterium]|jgi:ATP phosphoribosyltransferase|nr:ATP phosphoribosyltransferase [Spirochaetota bacterium]
MLQDNADLRIAVPSKGRLMDQSIDLLKKSGLKFHVHGRQLFALCDEMNTMVIFVNAQDIPALVGSCVVDLGITGSDLVYEKGIQLVEHRRLGFGQCRLSFASHADSGIKCAADFSGKTIGTKFVRSAAAYFESHSIPNVRIIEINGAVEVMVLLGLVDGILDLVETGSSLREHDLVEREVALLSEAVLVGNATPRDSALRDKLLRRIEGVFLAANWIMLEYNCPAEKLSEAKKITPGYSSPTIQNTDSKAWLAVKVMAEKASVQTCMDSLEALGCRGIIVTELVHCRL